MTDPSPKPRLHDTLAATIVKAQEALRPRDHAAKDARLTRWLDAFEGEMKAPLAIALAGVLDHPDTPDDVKQILAPLVAPEHAVTSPLLFAAVGALFYPIISAAMAGTAAVITQDSLAHSPFIALSPAEVALGQVRHTLGTLDPYDEVKHAGINAERFDILALNTGDAPPIEQLLLLYRRGEIDYATLVKGLHQSRLRDEWVSSVIALQYAPPGVGEVVAGALKGHLDVADATAKAAVAGLNPIEFGWLLQTAGRPYGIEQGLSLLNRGLIDETRMRQVVAQSDVNPDYTDDILQLRWYVPPVRSILPMLRSGAIDDARATELFRDHGVREVDIPAYLAEARHGRTQQVKELTASQVVRFYGARLIDGPTANERLSALGFDNADIQLWLEFADNERHERYVNAVLAKAHTLYVAHKADQNQVHAMLNGAGIAAAAVTDFLRLWTLERDATVHHPSPAAIVGAYRRHRLTAAECKARLLAFGVVQNDLEIVVADGFPPTTALATLNPLVDAVVNA